MSALKESATLPAQNMYQSKVNRPPLAGFVSCSKTLLDGEENLPNARTKKGCNPNVYKLIEKAGYDFNNPIALGKIVEVETYDLNETQKKIQKQGGQLEVLKVGHRSGYQGDAKPKQNVVQHISAEEIDESEDENA